MPYHISWTVPMSHYEYNEWWDKHEIGIHCHHGVSTSWLLSHGWGKSWLCLTHFQHQDCVCWDPYCHITAAELIQCLITSIMNGGTSIRLEFIVTKGLHQLTLHKIGIHCNQGSPQADFCVTGGGKAGLVLPTFSTKIVCVGILTAISQQLNCSNVSLQV